MTTLLFVSEVLAYRKKKYVETLLNRKLNDLEQIVDIMDDRCENF